MLLNRHIQNEPDAEANYPFENTPCLLHEAIKADKRNQLRSIMNAGTGRLSSNKAMKVYTDLLAGATDSSVCKTHKCGKDVVHKIRGLMR